MTSGPPTFEPHPLLAGFHRQTLASALLRGGRAPSAVTREVMVDEANRLRLRCSWHAPDRVEAGRPVLVLLHGLGGSADSPYMRVTARKAFAEGFDVVRVNQRGADDTADLVQASYHAALTDDVLAVLDDLAAEGRGPFALGGFSLGGNCALRLAGLQGGGLASRGVQAVVAISPSVDLPSCSEALDGDPRCRIYRDRFVQELGAVAARFAALGKGTHLYPLLHGVRSLRDFDDRWTARLHGFPDVDAYYERMSALPVLGRIAVPTLLIHARDDHLVPSAALEATRLPAGSPLRVVLTDSGGHCGFWARRRVREDGVRDADRAWAENRMLRFMARRLRPRPGGPVRPPTA